MSDSRMLDPIEIEVGGVAQRALGFGLGQAVTVYEGILDTNALREALTVLAARYPRLTARIARKGDGYNLQFSGGPTPNLRVIPGNLNTLLRECGRYFNSQWRNDQGIWTKSPQNHCDPTDWLARITVANDNSKGFILFEISHAVVDGTAFLQLHQELWKIYSQIVEGVRPLAEPVEALPTPPLQLVTERLHLSGPLSPSTAVTSRKDQLSAFYMNDAVVVKCQRIHLSGRDTTRLLNIAHSREVSVGALVLSKLSRILHEYDSLIGDRVRISAVVDLRRHAVPPVGALETTNFVGGVNISANLSNSRGAVDVAHEIYSGLRSSAAAGRFNIAGHLDSPSIQDLWNSDIFFNNAGRIEAFATPAGLDLVDFIPNLVSMWPDLPRKPGPVLDVIMYTYDERMSLLCRAPEGLEDAISTLNRRLTAAALSD